MLYWKGITGSVIASFVNVMVLRSRQKEDYLFSHSRCPDCGHQLNYLDMLPILGFIIRKGKCHYCGCRIPLRYPLVEITGAYLGIISHSVWEMIMFMDLLAIALYDRDNMIIKDSYLAVLLMCGLFTIDFRYLNNHLLGSVVISLPMYLLARLTEGFGMGDVKLMAVAGGILGWERCLLGFVLRCFAGSVVSIILLTRHKAGLKDRIPFGPFLVLGTVIACSYGFRLIDFYESIWVNGV
ncbi:MAG: prepilin peptidase [Erysipelotrichaceae bacterium]|nr:prepilin peptidase [Erysipelotrichaceae bacterium]